jgi:hypothetical protein
MDPISRALDHLPRIECNEEQVGEHYQSPIRITVDKEENEKVKNYQRYRLDKEESLAQVELGISNKLQHSQQLMQKKL